MVPVHLPDTRFGRYSAFWWSEPWRISAATTPAVSIGHRQNDMLAEFHISEVCAEMMCGSPCPPNCGSQFSPVQPPSENCRNASLKPGAAVMTLLSSLAPVRSPSLLSGSSTPAANLPASTSTASTRSGVTSSHPGNAEIWSRPTNSLMTNFMSRIGAAYVDIVVVPKNLNRKSHRKDAKDARRTITKYAVQKGPRP